MIATAKERARGSSHAGDSRDGGRLIVARTSSTTRGKHDAENTEPNPVRDIRKQLGPGRFSTVLASLRTAACITGEVAIVAVRPGGVPARSRSCAASAGVAVTVSEALVLLNGNRNTSLTPTSSRLAGSGSLSPKLADLCRQTGTARTTRARQLNHYPHPSYQPETDGG